MTRQTVLIVDCSPPRGEVLARLVRRQHVFCRVCAPDAAAGHVKRDPPAGLILAGEETAVSGELAAALRGFGLPVLAVGCAGPADGIRFAREPVPDAVHDFLFGTLRVRADWSMRDYAEETVRAVREQVGGGRVLLALSGGVDSSVCAALLDRAVGERLTCILVDHGLMRKNEADGVEAAFSGRGMRLIRVNARERFLGRLAGVADPERKRKIVGEEFIRVFEEEARKTGSADFLAQGTIYPDVMESGVGKGMVKSHHNVGGLPERIGFRAIIEPLRPLFKDEVRELGRLLGLSEALVERQPFPGPGLAIRCMGEVTESKLSVLREADAIFREELSEAGLAGDLSQFFAVLTDVRSVGVRGGRRTYDYTVALRAVRTDDFMTADWARIPFDLLDRVGRRITSETPSVNRVVYDITPKPPATIEWE